MLNTAYEAIQKILQIPVTFTRRAKLLKYYASCTENKDELYRVQLVIDAKNDEQQEKEVVSLATFLFANMDQKGLDKTTPGTGKTSDKKPGI